VGFLCATTFAERKINNNFKFKTSNIFKLHTIIIEKKTSSSQ
jgi:hypothetical protein